MEDNLKLKERFIDIFSPSSHLFGRVRTHGRSENKFEWNGCAVDKYTFDFVDRLSPAERKDLAKILTYFEIHMRPLRLLLEEDEILNEIAWSHFATLIMFGMLEVAVKVRQEGISSDSKLENKGRKIRDFLELHLPDSTKQALTQRYKTNIIRDKSVRKGNFKEVTQHLWEEVRSEFTHSAGIHWLGFEFGGLEQSNEKGGTVITFWQDVPIQEWLILTWQAIFHSFSSEKELIIIDTSTISLPRS